MDVPSKCQTSDVLCVDKSRPLLEDYEGMNVFLGNIYDTEVYSARDKLFKKAPSKTSGRKSLKHLT